MDIPHLPIDELPAWALLNDVSFIDTRVQNIPNRGYGLISTRDHPYDSSTVPPLLTVPHDLVLNPQAVKEHAKEDRRFQELLDAVQPSSPRTTVLLFLLVQTALARRGDSSSFGVSNPWREYIKFLPQESNRFVPTLWTEGERELLRGTSLEAALRAKDRALVREFDKVRDVSSAIPCWNELLWEDETVKCLDWISLDAVYRSRSLELPRAGESMVPCLDMVNHAEPPNAYYEENFQDGVSLVRAEGVKISEGEEVTISYGYDKSAAEMLYSYGFLDTSWLPTKETFQLPFDTSFMEDPLAKAKMVAFGEPPRVHLRYDRHGARTEGITPDFVHWECPFAFLFCLNEEDGLEFVTLQQTDGKRELRVKFLEEDVTEKVKEFDTLILNHKMGQLFKYRATEAVKHSLEVEYQKILDTDWPSSLAPDVRSECFDLALGLRKIQRPILKAALEKLQGQSEAMADEDVVVNYLAAPDEPDDFS